MSDSVIFCGSISGVSFKKKELAGCYKFLFDHADVDKARHVDVVLEPDPTNQYDPNAIKVLVGKKDEIMFNVGFIPKKINELILKEDLSSLQTKFLRMNYDIGNRVVGLKIMVSK